MKLQTYGSEYKRLRVQIETQSEMVSTKNPDLKPNIKFKTNKSDLKRVPIEKRTDPKSQSKQNQR